MSDGHLRDRIRAHTEIAGPHLCPMLRLHLITPRCALWHGNEESAEAVGLKDPYWGFAWPGGQALARTLLDQPELVRGKRVLDFGSGSGIQGFAAALAGAREVIACDIDPIATCAIEMNAELNGLEVRATQQGYLGRDPVEEPVDLILAGDVCYDDALTAQIVAWLRAESSAGATVLLGDPGRGFFDADAEVVAKHLAPADIDADGANLIPCVVYRL